jgi:hypothetical protein
VALFGVSLLFSAATASAEDCGKNREGTILQLQFQAPAAQAVPKFRPGAAAGEDLQLRSGREIAKLVVLASPSEVESLALIVGGQQFPLKPCNAQVEGLKQLRAFEIDNKALIRVAEAVKKSGPARLQVRWRKKIQGGKVYVADPAS